MSQYTQIYAMERKLAFSTTTPLAANAVYTSPTVDAINYKFTTARTFSDQAGSYVLQHSDDGVAFDSTNSTTTTASTLSTLNGAILLAKYARLVYTNGTTPQTSFRLGAYLSPL